MTFNTVKNTILEITLFLSVYASTVIINALIKGVISSYVMLAALVEWGGCFLMDILLECVSDKDDNPEKTWLITAALTVIVTAMIQPVTAIVTGLCYLLMVLIYEKYSHHLIAILSSFVTLLAVTSFLIFYLRSGKGFSLSLSLCFMNFRMCRKWIVNHPKTYVTLEMHDEKWKKKNCILLILVHIAETFSSLIMGCTVMKNGMYAVMEKELYHPGEMITVFPVCILVLLLCSYLKERLTLSDMNHVEKEVIPSLASLVVGMITISYFVMRVYLYAGIYLIACLIAISALCYILVGREKKHLKAVRVLLSPVSLFMLVTAFILVYNQYDGMTINAITCGTVMVMLLCMHMWIIHLEELL